MKAAKLTGRPAVAPYSGDVWDLADCSLVYKAPVVPVISKQARTAPTESPSTGFKVTPSTAKAVSAYEDLKKNGSELIELINNSQGDSNKELRALTAEIAELLKKYRK